MTDRPPTEAVHQTTEAYDPAYALFLARSPGNAATAVHYWRNTAGERAQSFQRFMWLSMAHHELRRAMLGIDPPTAWCGDRDARIRRFFDRVRNLPKPRLP
jgi:hypothetical protein